MNCLRWIAMFVSLMMGHWLSADNYGNEWIDFPKTYYKFRVWKDGLYRIPYATLQSAGINETELVGNNIKLFRNGDEVPLYVSNNGQLTSSDNIEFYGFKNDGRPDTELFKNADDQPHPYYSFFNDTVTYFLVIDPAANGKRYTTISNNLIGAPAKEPYFMHVARSIFTNIYNYGGPFNPYYTSFADSEYIPGEGYADNYVFGPNTKSQNIATAKIYQGSSPDPTANVVYSFFNTGVVHDDLVRIGSKTNRDVTFEINDARRVTLNLEKSDLTEGLTPVSLTPQTTGEQVSLNMIEIIYARLFDFENKNVFRFNLDKKTDTYIEISNFNAAASIPLLFDQSNLQRMEGITEGGILKFRLPASVKNKNDLILTSTDVATINLISSLEPKVFTNFLSAENQGNYYIISNKRLIPSTDGTNYIEAYRDYRASEEGGSWNAKLVYIDELEDQFAWGIKYNTLAITHFARFGVDKFDIPLENIFIIGKGFPPNPVRINAVSRELCMVQTMGLPASDNLMARRSANDPTMVCGLGRLSVSKGDQIRDYLDKVISVEANYNDTSAIAQTIDNKSWQKEVLHLAGGNSNDEQLVFRAYMEEYERIIEDPYFGGNVSLLAKNVSDPIQVAQNVFLDSIFKSGLSLITFFGHSATTAIDFNIVPESMENPGKEPVMISNGCFVGNIFQSGSLLSERFLLTPGQGTIAYIAPFSYAVAPALNSFSSLFYQNTAVDNYGKSLGVIMKNSLSPLMSSPNILDKMLAQQMIFHGDPGILLSHTASPDYAIDQRSVSFNPQIINLGKDSFSLKLSVHNLGKAVNGDYNVYVERRFPNGEVEIITTRMNAPRFLDSITVRFATNKVIGAGINSFRIKIDSDEEIDELSEFNNEITVEKAIFDDDIIPLIPYEFSIINKPEDFKLAFTTINPFSEIRSYILQIDTTENYNSPLFLEIHVLQSGGVVNWIPAINKLPNTVYYFRSSLDTLYGNPLVWNSSSFLYNTSLSEGWNQSHYFQYLKDELNTMKLPENRKFTYSDDIRDIQLHTGTFDVIPAAEIYMAFDGFVQARNSFTRVGLMFFVYDINKAAALETYNTGNNIGPYGDIAAFTTPGVRLKVIQFNTDLIGSRTSVMNFLENSVPDDAIVFCYSFGDPKYSTWANDSIFLGKNLFQVFEQQLGSKKVRQASSATPWVFFGQKGNPSFQTEEFNILPSDVVDTSFNFSARWYKGSVTSTLIGPSSDWGSFDFDQFSLDSPDFDKNNFKIYGLPYDGLARTELYSNITTPVDPLNIDAEAFPYLQLEWESQDDSNTTPSQFDFWRVIYQPVPEAAINPQLHFVSSNDTIDLGGTYSVSTALQNLTSIGMDSMLVKFTIKNPQGQSRSYYKRYGPLPGNDTIHIGLSNTFLDPVEYGVNTIVIEANPDNDQAEKFHPNNIAILSIFVSRDRANPLLDVTFDGRHIVDGDIVSPKPEIRIKLKDENKQLALDDTSGFDIFIIDPLDALNPIRLNLSDPSVQFIPADPSQLATKNEAVVIFSPEFIRDGTYQLRVQGADKSNNDAGKYDFRVSFEIVSKPAISNMLNYPNPFSTSTQFVFTLTGTTVPDDIMIQIMTVTGKVVREISREELGAIRIGQNITDFKWNGTDQYGDRLANGLYLYRVKAKLNGFSMDKLETDADKYFKRGYGKMYLMR